MGAKIRHFNRSLVQCYPCYPSSSGSPGGSAEPHRAEIDGPGEPGRDGEGAFSKVGAATLARMGLDPVTHSGTVREQKEGWAASRTR
jgi:hypothetical protein